MIANRETVAKSSLAIALIWVFTASVVTGAIATDRVECGRQKCVVPEERKFKYEEGVYYRYRYEVNVSTNLGEPLTPGSSKNESILHVNALVTLNFLTPCEGRLKFRDVSISHDRASYNAEFPDRAGAEFKGNLEQFSLRFAFNDGEVQELCPDSRETVWALNMKRGVLSMLQNTMNRFDVDRRVDETDVNGICETTYRLHEAKKTSLIIKKSKNLIRCVQGGKHLSIIQSTLYKSPLSRLSKSPLLKSHAECEITIDHNVYQTVVCTDVHKLQPLSNGAEAGVRSESTASLHLFEEVREDELDDYDEFEDEENGQFKFSKDVAYSRRLTLLYDHAKAPKTMHGELRASRDLLKSICKLASNSSNEIPKRFSETFTAFVHSTRLLDYPSLSQLYARANGICKNGKKHFVTALPFMGSNPAVAVMKDLIVRKFIPRTTVESWVTMFALIPRPDRNTIKALAPLLELQHEMPEAQFALSYSAVIHAYCSNNDVDCVQIEHVQRFLSHLEGKINNGCSPRTKTPEEIRETLEALKAIGNMGLETASLREKLKQCADDVGGFLPNEISIAAIDAHRRLPSCEKTRDEFLLANYRNFTLDTEIRIASYLQVMRCPDYNVIKIIKRTLHEEEVNQVGSFVWSHLTNLYNSASPTMVEIQSLLTDRDLGTKFNSDIRKFSRNYDGSFFSEEYNFGANYQTNLIFSPKSYIPRTASLNVTMDLFGESVNIFEVTTRMEGLEYYAENLFGPNGPYSNKKMSGYFGKFLRSFRSLPEDDDYWNQVKELPNVIDNNFDEPRVSFSYKIFGNELKFMTYNGDAELRSILANLNPLEKVKKMLSGQEIHYENSAMFLDSSYVVPLTSGLSMRLDLTGSAACNFKMSGSLNTKNFASKNEIEIIGNIMPSVSVDVVGSMTVDAFYKSAGIKLRGNVYSSSAVKVHLNVKGTRLVQLNIGLPNHEMEVFSTFTDVLLTTGNGAEVEERAIGSLVVNQDKKQSRLTPPPSDIIHNTTCSWPALDKLIGLKLCTTYQLPNVTNNPNSSYFILNGPTLFKVSLVKADPTAKSYLLEYKWDRTEDMSVLRLAFDTPGSEVNREISGTVSFDAKTRNVSILLLSAGNRIVAKGTYKSSDDETFIDVGFDVNGTKHLDATIGYSRKKFSYGYTYHPKVQLTINNERVAAITGTIRNGEKNNVSQSDIELTFQTKRVWSKLAGYIVRRNISISGDLQLDYQLQKMPKKETIHLEVSLANRSSKTLTHKAADIKLRSTAYPQLNTVINAWYQQALGHLELHAEVNSSPYLKDDRHKLTAQLVISYSKVFFQSQGTKVSALFAITKPIQNLDIRVGMNHYSIGAETKSNFLVGYAPGKEISLIVNTVIPHGQLFAMEGHANLTIPNFNSLLVDVRVNERARREYDLYFAGTWFSGHNITARGTYVDGSTMSTVNHSLKLILKSPSFPSDVLVTLRIVRKHNESKTSLFIEQVDMDKYALVVHHRLGDPNAMGDERKTMGYVEGRYKKRVYSILGNIDAGREIDVQMHLDDWRDVHVTLTSINEEIKKELGVEVKWDANRDPSLKFATIMRLDKYIGTEDVHNSVPNKNLTGTVILTYPGRLVRGYCVVASHAPYKYVVDTALEWDPESAIQLSMNTYFDVTATKTGLLFESQLLTPFEQWKKTSLNVNYLQSLNSLQASGSVYWKDSQHVITNFYGSKSEINDTREWVANFGLTSTVHSIGWVVVNTTHKVINSKSADSRLLIKYNPYEVIDARSTWFLEKESDGVFNLTGILHLESPLVNYRKGDMKCQLRVMRDWKFNGAANLEMDKRKYTGNLIGDLAQIRESVIQFNVTTPIEKYAFLRGRFGLSEKNRHVVAEVVTPTGPLGFEVICQLFTAMYDFNIKLMLATPIDLLQESLLVAKLNRREADFRVAYNNITVGFQGVWHYHNITDFHYSYIVYTPLHGLHESGINAKLVITYLEPDGKLDVDTEFTVRLVETKVGVKAKGGPKPPPVRVNVQKNVEPTEEETDIDYYEEDPDETLYWRAELEIYAAIIEPIVGELDLDYENSVYRILSTLKIPKGEIIVDDRFWFEDVFHMRNDLEIDTPFNYASQITSTYLFNLDMDNSVYLIQMDVNVKKNTSWIETGFSGNYTFLEGEQDDSRTHSIKFDVKTPLDFLKYFNTTTVVEIDENFYKSSVTLRGVNCTALLNGYLELDEAFVDTTVSMRIDAPELKIPKLRIAAKKDFTDKEKHLKFSTSIGDSDPKTATFEAIWQFDGDNFTKAFVALDTWLEPLRAIETDLLFVNSISRNGTGKLNAMFKYHGDQQFAISGVINNGTINVDITTPIPSKVHLRFNGIVQPINETHFKVEGDLTNIHTLVVYKVLSAIATSDTGISTIETKIRPKLDSTTENEITITFEKEKYGLKLFASGSNFNGNVSVNVVNSLNWDVRTKLETRLSKGSTAWQNYELNTFMNVQVNGHTTLHVHVETPWEDIELAKIDGSLLLSNNGGDVDLKHTLNRNKYELAFSWKLIYLANMFGKIMSRYEIEDFGTKDFQAHLFFKNPNRAFRNVDIGFDVDIDKEKWKFATNATVGFRNDKNIDAVVTVRLPPPDNDTHRVLISYHANNRGLQDMSYVLGYNALKTNVNYASDGSFRMVSRDIDGHFRFTWGMLPSQSINNLFNVTLDQKQIELKYTLFTPKYLQEETAMVHFIYDGVNDESNVINADIFYPTRQSLASARILYSSLINVNGTVNVTAPVAYLPYVGCDFVVLTTLKRNNRYVKVFWPNNTALLNSDYSYHSERLDSNLDGSLRLEVPLNTRHVAYLTYGYKKRPLLTTGYSIMDYNGQKIVNGKYHSKSESRAGFEKDHIRITVENIYKPIGIEYVNQFEYSAGNEGTNYPNVEYKNINVYQLDNRTAFDVSGEFRLKTNHTGQDVYMKAVHSNRTVQLNTNYEVLPGEFDQKTWLSLAEDAWVSYRINIVNKTTEEMDNQFLIVNLAYPRRNFTFDSSYMITSKELFSEARLDWDQDTEKPRTVGAAFNCKTFNETDPLKQQVAILSLRHPSFEEDVTITGRLIKEDPKDLLNVDLTVNYSTKPEKLMVLSTLFRDESDIDRKYSYRVSGKHPRTRLDLEIEGFLLKQNDKTTYSTVLLETKNHGHYKRTFLPEENGQFHAKIDVLNREILFNRRSNEVAKYLQIRYYPMYPHYILNGSIINTPELNASGALFFDPQEKLTWMMLNYTPDATRSLRMYGKIPDARNAVFNIWRTYEQDLTISDVSFYLKLNHSRLITSNLKWRPEIRNDMINAVKTTIYDLYEGINRDADYWKQYVRSETVSVISDVWQDAQEEMAEFVQDWNDLKHLEEDFEDLKMYLNNSYNANDFYIKDIVAFGLYVIDELSIRNHMQSLPNILNEIYEIMGESGEAIRNSLIWVIETIKSGFTKISEIITAVLRGDSISQVANIIEKLIEKYDMFVKDLHVSFIKYIENLWDTIWVSIGQQWHRFLKLVEPLFIQMLHYLETMVWKASKEIVDFLYDRRNEIMTSPYFDRFTKFTHDVDRFYRDIKANDIVTNVRKYSTLLVQFLKERYFTFVPFGKELKDVVDEILSEVTELKKLPSVHYTLEKMQQIYDRAYYLYDYLGIQTKIENAIRLVHSKLIDISQTALEAESRYREAKTKFIFDPHQGLMCLEQKLPMSWHAFNQTPEFQEIPEYRAVADMGKFFTTSNTTFWSLYYQYKPFTEPSNWLPPFKAQAMIIGTQHYVTFDGVHFDFTGPCTYLLAHDFVRNTFSVLVKYGWKDDEMSHKIIVLIDDKAIELDIVNDIVTVVEKGVLKEPTDLQLPFEMRNGSTFVYRKDNVVTVELSNKQFKLECNLKFDLCILELSGWYFGKTAGLLGTMNNEKMDDMTTSNGYIVEDVETFASSWSVDKGTCQSDKKPIKQISNNETDFCEELFTNKSSEFNTCFKIVDPSHFAKLCHNSINEKNVCTAAVSYMQACMFHNTYLRIPDRCTTCSMVDGTLIAEGDTRSLEDDSVPKSVDVVFIVEAKECNRDIKTNRSIDQLVTQMNKELRDQGLQNNRWSLVLFGGNGVFDQPRSVILDSQIFTKNPARFVDYFDHVQPGNGNQDIFAAIGFASQLVFRAGVSKTFVLIPCSHCEAENQTLDYSVLHQVLLEHGITLHILMDGDFEFEKERLNKIFYGLDATKSYTKKDARTLVGDVELRRQVKLSKTALGYCTPLSLETNGTIFSGDKLRFDKLPAIKKFATVFSKRVALTAQPNSCQHCECIADNNGATQMECMPCVYPTPVAVDYVSDMFNFTDSFLVMPSSDVDYGQIDIEDE